MYQLLYFPLKLVAVIDMMSLDPMELTPHSRLIFHYLGLGDMRYWNIVQVKYLAPDLFSTGV